MAVRRTGSYDPTGGTSPGLTPKPGVIGAPHQASAILTSYIAPMPIRKCLLALAMLGVILTSSLLASSSLPAVAAVPPQPSFGCGSGASPVQGQQSFDFSAAGEVGSYIVEMPPDGSAKDPLPLIIDLHGYSETAAIQANFRPLAATGRLTISLR